MWWLFRFIRKMLHSQNEDISHYIIKSTTSHVITLIMLELLLWLMWLMCGTAVPFAQTYTHLSNHVSN